MYRPQHVGLVAAGTGITPMFQLLRAAVSDPRDTARYSLLYASHCLDDVLLRSELEDLVKAANGRHSAVDDYSGATKRLTITHMLSSGCPRGSKIGGRSSGLSTALERAMAACAEGDESADNSAIGTGKSSYYYGSDSTSCSPQVVVAAQERGGGAYSDFPAAPAPTELEGVQWCW
jgi:Oxidoreductase NAD-binding domain